MVRLKFLGCGIVVVCLSTAGGAGKGRADLITIGFETDDRFPTLTDPVASPNPLVNGQAIHSDARMDPVNPAVPLSSDTVLEFGTVVRVTDSIIGADGHLGPVIFDSDPADQLPGTQDPDLLVGKGNILVLQNDDSPATTLDPLQGLLFDFPNDEASFGDRGSIIFDFVNPFVANHSVTPQSIDLIDIDRSVEVRLTLQDSRGGTRVYDVPSSWTRDINAAGPAGYDTLFLNTLLPQLGEGGSTVAAPTDAGGYDPTDVVRLKVCFIGSSPSAGLDDLVFDDPHFVDGVVVPEPATALLVAAGLTLLGPRRCRRPVTG